MSGATQTRPVPARTAPEPAATTSGGFTGTLPLLRLALRRDRILVPGWVLFFVLLAYSSAAATVDLYPDVASRVQAAAAVNKSVAIRALYGTIWDERSVGQLSLFKFNALGMALVAILSFMLVTRHTRAEEEDGRLELLGAGVVGRYAALSAGLLLAVVADVVLAVLTWLCLTAAGLPAAGSLAFGLTWLVAGVAFAGVAAVAAQLTTSARAANGIAGAVLGVAYVLRALGDAGTPWASWVSPIGWAQQVKAFSGDRWGLLALPLLLAVVLTAVAYALVTRRDLGGGLLADRAGPSRAQSYLGNPFGLALRLQRGILLAWTLAFVVLGAVFGSLVSSVGDFLGNEQSKEVIQRMGGGLANLTDAYLATVFSMVAVITSVFAVQSVLRLRAEETGGRAEPTLATAVGRRRWVAGHVAVAVLGSLWLLLLMALVAGSVYARTSGDAGQVGRLLGAGLAQLPAVLVMVGVTVAAYALSPRLGALGWAFLVLCFALDGIGPLLELDDRILGITPFSHVPRLPGGAFSVAPLVWLTVVALALLAFGFERFRRRDLG